MAASEKAPHESGHCPRNAAVMRQLRVEELPCCMNAPLRTAEASIGVARRAHPGTAPKLWAAVGRNAAFMRQGSRSTRDCRINAVFRRQRPDARGAFSLGA